MKNIILLSDGTGNSSHDPFKTNVWRLYQALDLNRSEDNTLHKDNPDLPDQIAYYDDGVGTSSFQPLALLGGAFGWGLKRNVLDLYTFLCRNYQPDDQIYCFGFSRGAFTVRVLAGLIANQGLVKAADEAELQRFAAAAFRAYRACYHQDRKLYNPFNLAGLVIRYLRDAGVWMIDKLLHRKHYSQAEKIRKGDDTTIQLIGVWDTVAAYGLPVDELTRAWDFIFPISFPDQNLGKGIQRACHALALDDERHSFHPELWNEDEEKYPGLSAQPANAAPTDEKPLHERLLQVWFAGMHSDVGGSYPDDAMSFVPLEWMLDQAEDAGLRFKQREVQAIREAANLRGPLHDSRRGMGGYYRYRPRKLDELLHDEDSQVEIKWPKIHQSVFDRIAEGTDGYAPIVLPAEYIVYKPLKRADEQAQTDGLSVRSRQDLLPQAIRQRAELHWQDQQGQVRQATCQSEEKIHEVADAPDTTTHLPETREQANNRHQLQEQIWDLVWKKRVVYFATVFASLVLLAFPLWRPAQAACGGPACAIAPLIGIAGALLPGMFSSWVKAFQSHPGSFLILFLLIVWLMGRSARYQRRIFDAMREIWTPLLVPHASPFAPMPKTPDAYLESSTISRRQLKKLTWGNRLANGGLGLVGLLCAAFTYNGAVAQGMSAASSQSSIDLLVMRLAAPWLSGYQRQPSLLLAALSVSLLAVVLLQARKNYYQRTAAQAVCAIWKPLLFHPQLSESVVHLPRGWIFRLRHNWFYQAMIQAFRKWILPAVAGILTGLILVTGGSHFIFAMLESAGCVCQKSSEQKPLTEAQTFVNDQPCWATGWRVEEGHRYKLTLTKSAGMPWRDKTIDAALGGFQVKEQDWRTQSLLYAVTLLRRNLSATWFQPIARIGEYGHDEYVLEPKGSASADKLVAEITARRTGELFLYLNDAALPINVALPLGDCYPTQPDSPSQWGGFYRNNCGAANVTIERINEEGKGHSFSP